jgi:DNA-binding beta-propeller fold protein YncE
VCVGAVLGDAQRRVSVVGGREGMPRSLGSVYGGAVTLFLGGGMRGVVSRVIATRGIVTLGNGMAISRDGRTMLLSDCRRAILRLGVDGATSHRVIGKKGSGAPLRFERPHQVWIAPDDFVFVADQLNSRVQVLTPDHDFHSFVGVGLLDRPTGVCANADIVVASEYANRVTVLSRVDGSVLRRFGSHGSADGELILPQGLCFMCGDRHVAVADHFNHRVSVFSVDGEFIRHVGVGVLRYPVGVACTSFDELVVANCGSSGVVLFSASGAMAMTLGSGVFTSVALQSGVVIAHEYEGPCMMFVGQV